MYYNNNSELPIYVKAYSDKIQRQFVAVFNTVYDKVLIETHNKEEADKRAFMAANSVLGKRFSGSSCMANNTRGDYFNFLVDKFIKNI